MIVVSDETRLETWPPISPVGDPTKEDHHSR
jgi:hypothetical protein